MQAMASPPLAAAQHQQPTGDALRARQLSAAAWFGSYNLQQLHWVHQEAPRPCTASSNLFTSTGMCCDCQSHDAASYAFAVLSWLLLGTPATAGCDTPF